MKDLLLYIFDNHLHLLASKLYMIDISPANFRSQIDLLWNHCDQIADVTAFVFENLDRFFDTFCLI